MAKLGSRTAGTRQEVCECGIATPRNAASSARFTSLGSLSQTRAGYGNRSRAERRAKWITKAMNFHPSQPGVIEQESGNRTARRPTEQNSLDCRFYTIT